MMQKSNIRQKDDAAALQKKHITRTVSENSPPSGTENTPRSFFSETLELLGGFVAPEGDITFGCEYIKEELSRKGQSPAPSTADMCMRFGSAKSPFPSLCVAFCSEEVEKVVQKHRHALVIVTDLSAFRQAYPEGEKDSRLKNVCLGGFVNLGPTPAEHARLFSASLLTSWILCGPFFDIFWEHRSFDLLYYSSYDPFFRSLLQVLLHCWSANLNWYSSHEKEIACIREKSAVFRKTSTNVLTFSQQNDYFQDGFVNWLSEQGDIRRVPITHELGWDNKKRGWNRVLQKMVDPDHLLSVIKKEEPPFSLETNWYNSPLQLFYERKVSPRFILNRCGIPQHHIVVDPVFSVSELICDAFADLFIRSENALYYAPYRIPNAYRILDFNFPAVYLAENKEKKEQQAQRTDTIRYILQKDVNTSGFFLATNFRQETILPVAHHTRRIFLFSSIMLYRRVIRQPEAYRTLTFINQIFYSILQTILSQIHHSSFDVFFSTAQDLGKISNAQQSFIKLALALDAARASKKINAPFRVYSSGSWTGGDKGIWRGFIPKEQVDTLGKFGWIRIAPQFQSPGSPFHDMNDALTNGYICLGINGYDEESSPQYYKHIAPYTFTTPSMLQTRMAEAVANPTEMFEAMKRGAQPLDLKQQGSAPFVSSFNICDHLRLFPYEAPTLGAPINRVVHPYYLPIYDELNKELATLEPYLYDPEGIKKFVKQLPEEEMEYALLLRSFLDL